MAENRTQRLRFGVVAITALAAFAVALTAGGAVAAPAARTANAGVAAQQDLSHPTKALCKKSSYKIGYDVFSDTQPFAVSLTNGLIDAAKSIGCAQVVKAVDNLNGPVAVGNVKTLLNEGIDGFVDFQVLANYQPAIAKLLKCAQGSGRHRRRGDASRIPAGRAGAFQTEKNAAVYMAKQAKKQFPGQTPYFLGGAEPTSGAAVLARYKGAVAGIKQEYPGIPSDHIIQVNTEGVATTAYTTTLSALSKVPSDAVVLMQAVNDEDLGGMYKAAQARHVANYLVNSFGGDSYGLKQVCADPKHYVGAWYLDPAGWGPVLLSLIMNQMNGVKVPKVTNIAGFEVTHSSRSPTVSSSSEKRNRCPHGAVADSRLRRPLAGSVHISRIPTPPGEGEATREARMKPGLGLYKQMLTPENFRFARQAGAEAIVAHLVDYMPGGPRIPDAKTVPQGWGVASRFDIWTVEELVDLRRAVEAEGLELAALENFEIGHWYDVLLDGPRKQEQLEGLRALIRNVGEAGIPIIGYNFSLAAVWATPPGLSDAEAPSRFASTAPRPRPRPRFPGAWSGT